MGQKDNYATASVTLRLPKEMKKRMHISAINNCRTLTQEIKYFIFLGIQAKDRGLVLEEVKS